MRGSKGGLAGVTKRDAAAATTTTTTTTAAMREGEDGRECDEAMDEYKMAEKKAVFLVGKAWSVERSVEGRHERCRAGKRDFGVVLLLWPWTVGEWIRRCA